MRREDPQDASKPRDRANTPPHAATGAVSEQRVRLTTKESSTHINLRPAVDTNLERRHLSYKPRSETWKASPMNHAPITEKNIEI
ncbi:hypothetical protein Bca4012_062294 [Brassica carinata]|uniref:Uncharacterized protein n=1 Tax=Brassica carinata TaxID=52824 RepID=A0A8X7SCM9_BRACI|nr:hypothetical protein Bca52824_032203 [Brassica carinata]